MWKYFEHSILYYWYVKSKKVAVVGFIIALFLDILLLYIFGYMHYLWIVFAILSDICIVALAFIYLLLPEYLSFLEGFFVAQFISVVIMFVLNRFIVNYLAIKVYKIV